MLSFPSSPSPLSVDSTALHLPLASNEPYTSPFVTTSSSTATFHSTIMLGLVCLSLVLAPLTLAADFLSFPLPAPQAFTLPNGTVDFVQLVAASNRIVEKYTLRIPPPTLTTLLPVLGAQGNQNDRKAEQVEMDDETTDEASSLAAIGKAPAPVKRTTTSYIAPLTNHGIQYTGNMSFGTPPQPIVLTFDTGQSLLTCCGYCSPNS